MYSSAARTYALHIFRLRPVRLWSSRWLNILYYRHPCNLSHSLSALHLSSTRRHQRPAQSRQGGQSRYVAWRYGRINRNPPPLHSRLTLSRLRAAHLAQWTEPYQAPCSSTPLHSRRSLVASPLSRGAAPYAYPDAEPPGDRPRKGARSSRRHVRTYSFLRSRPCISPHHRPQIHSSP